MAIQLQEFAKQVLFGTTIEEKLSFPREEIVDTRPGVAIDTPRHLARPPHLALREDGARAAPPSEAKLVDESERGRLLHFFGNHELLATELMALALLKFPEAPASFRRGLLETLKDEQSHTRIYIHRMKQCGVTFGELPLSDYFWKSVSSMQDPLDYVTRLSLTFEQANLDYAREYAQIFDAAGDATTAAILNKIYCDEIGHVGFGLRWFRRWKAADKSDWQAFRDRLAFPLSPARAKGNRFNAEGRKAAGFDKEFIRDLQVFSQSRGRTPNVWWFNPAAESFAARNTSEGLSWGRSPLERDLAFLLSCLAGKDDILIVPRKPSAEFLRSMHKIGFQLPELLESDGSECGSPSAPTIDRKLGSLRPWAWTPDSIAFFGETFSSLTCHVNADTLWNERIRALYAKTWAADWARQLMGIQGPSDWLAPPEVYGRPVENLDELLAYRQRVAQLGYANLACKAPFGTAANGNRCLLEGESVTPELESWLDRIWNQQGSILVEPWLDRVYDFSVHFDRNRESLKLIGFLRLLNNERGQFRGILTNAFVQGLEPPLARFLMQREGGSPRLFRWYRDVLGPSLANSLDQAGFTGPLGLDAFVYRDPQGTLRLKSVAEINPRFTMGRLAHEIAKRQATRSVGYFQILTRSQLRWSRAKTFASLVATMDKMHPVRLEDSPQRRIRSGSFSLCDAAAAEQFLALYHVRAAVDELPLGKQQSASGKL